MTRFFAFILGLGATGYGVWIIVSDNSRNTACNASNPNIGGLTTNIGMGSGCLNIVWVYFLGFALLSFGILLTVVAASMMRKMRRRGKYVERKPSPHAGKPS
jgi:predicted lipid-binding transport protein (Tim44 family)